MNSLITVHAAAAPYDAKDRSCLPLFHWSRRYVTTIIACGSCDQRAYRLQEGCVDSKRVGMQVVYPLSRNRRCQCDGSRTWPPLTSTLWPQAGNEWTLFPRGQHVSKCPPPPPGSTIGSTIGGRALRGMKPSMDLFISGLADAARRNGATVRRTAVGSPVPEFRVRRLVLSFRLCSLH